MASDVSSILSGIAMLSLAFLIPGVAAAVKVDIPPAQIKGSSNPLSFDPLGVLAVLSNPRATASAARLYLQPDRPAFRWPHLLQIGGTLTPLDMLVRHVTGNWKSVHPAAEVAAESMVTMEVKADIGSMGDYPKLMVDASNEWLMGQLNFKPSRRFPGSDINIIRVRSLNETGVYYHHELDKQSPRARRGTGLSDDDPFRTEFKFPSWKDGHGVWLKVMAARATLYIIEFALVIAVISGIGFSARYGDMWAAALYSCYFLHWLASWLVSRTILVIPAPLQVLRDASMRFVVFQREAGGAVIFLGPQDVLEKWARTKWQFNKSAGHNSAVHWFWITTGSLAAMASVACMVNMGGYPQLGFLAMLAYSSVGEILLTLLARYLRLQSRPYDRPTLIKHSTKWYMSIIQATLGVDDSHRLCGRYDSPAAAAAGPTYGIEWSKYRLLPSREPFEGMYDAMAYLNEHEADLDVLAAAEARFRARQPTPGPGARAAMGASLADRIWAEIERVWRERTQLQADPKD